MEESKRFKDIILDGKPIFDCEMVYTGKYGNSRLYVSKDAQANSFCAHAVSFVSVPAEEGQMDVWEHSELEVDTLFTVTAYFDGVRHLEFNRNGTDMDGYLYYPPMADLIKMLKKVREIELEICRDADKD